LPGTDSGAPEFTVCKLSAHKGTSIGRPASAVSLNDLIGLLEGVAYELIRVKGGYRGAMKIWLDSVTEPVST
jgi:hypothetical protein